MSNINGQLLYIWLNAYGTDRGVVERSGMAKGLVKSAERVFLILEFFSETRRPCRLSEIATNLGLPVSSVSLLLQCMVEKGYMDFDSETYGYMPSGRIGHLTSWIGAGDYEQHLVLDEMWRLREATQESVVLATPIGIYLEYVETVQGSESIRMKRGTRRLLVQTGTGWLFLSRISEDEALSIYWQTVGAELLDRSKFSEAQFLQKLARHRDTDLSFVHARELVSPTAHWGAAMLSMIIPVPPGHRKLAIGAHGLSERLNEKQEQISAELARISQTLSDHVQQLH